jgi:hypothetical protein
MPAVEQITDVRVLQTIAAQLELELRTAQAFMGMMILASGGKIDVPEEVSGQLQDDFEINVTRDEKVATFSVVMGEEAAALRQERDTVTVDADSFPSQDIGGRQTFGAHA